MRLGSLGSGLRLGGAVVWSGVGDKWNKPGVLAVVAVVVVVAVEHDMTGHGVMWSGVVWCGVVCRGAACCGVAWGTCRTNLECLQL